MFDPKTKILVVDDMATMRKLLVRACKEIGFTEIDEAIDGVEAWSKIGEARPVYGMIICDWEMPTASGIDLLRRMRSDGRVGKTPFLIATLEPDEKQLDELVRAGADSYVVKPFTPESLRMSLEAAYRKAGTR